jgi:hypothetical protein
VIVIGLGLSAVFGWSSFGCSEAGAERDVVARIEAPSGTLELDRRVVEQLASELGVDEAEAQTIALDRLRWVAARRERLAARETPPEHPDDLDPARRERLERAALVRLWMTEVFEPATAAAKIPARLVAENFANPAISRRLFHPELWLTCQVLIVPSEVDPDGRNVLIPSDPELAAKWQADASQAFAPMIARVEGFGPELVGDPRCPILAAIVGGSERELETPSGPMTIRFESFGFAPELADGFDRGWLEQVTAKPEIGLVGPFATKFGQHLVIVNEIKPPVLPDGSLPADQLMAARDPVLRAEIELAWRADQLQRALGDARQRRVVRLASDLSGGPE